MMLVQLQSNPVISLQQWNSLGRFAGDLAVLTKVQTCSRDMKIVSLFQFSGEADVSWFLRLRGCWPFLEYIRRSALRSVLTPKTFVELRRRKMLATKFVEAGAGFVVDQRYLDPHCGWKKCRFRKRQNRRRNQKKCYKPTKMPQL